MARFRVSALPWAAVAAILMVGAADVGASHLGDGQWPGTWMRV